MKPKRDKAYTDYSYVTANELKRILNLSKEGVDFVLEHGHVLGTVIATREKYILGHVRKAQDRIVQKHHEEETEVLDRAKPAVRRAVRHVRAKAV